MRITIDGKDLYYGVGSGNAGDEAQSIVFIHGAGFDHSVWVMPSRFFARHGMRVVALDLPEHGRSDGPARDSIDAMAEAVVDVITELGITRTVVVGHSMGSLVAYTLAARYPEKVSKLALLGTSAPMPVTDLLLNAARDNHHAAIEMANTWSHSTRGSLGAAENPGMSNLVSGERLLERVGDGVYHADLAACNDFDANALPQVTAETLVIIGAEDKMTPAKAGIAVAENLGGARTCVLPGCGHSMLSEQPNAVLDALADFIGVTDG